MEHTSIQIPTPPVERTDTEDIELYPGVTGTQQDQDEGTCLVDTLRVVKHIEDSLGHQEANEKPNENPATLDTVEGYYPKHGAGTTSGGKDMPDQKQAGELQNLSSETTYHWLKDITTRVASIEGRLIEHSPKATDSMISLEEDDSYMFRTSPEVKDCHWEAFKNRFLTEEDTVPAIETLLRYAEMDTEIEEEQLKRQSHGSGYPPAYQKPTKPSSKSPSAAPDDTYERIRINSAYILAFLSKVTGEGSWAKPPLKSFTFLRPFKILVHFKERMEEELLWLEKSFGRSALADQAPALGTEGSPIMTDTEVPVEEHQPVSEAWVRNSHAEIEKEMNTIQYAPAGLVVDLSQPDDKDGTGSQGPPSQNEGKVKANQVLIDAIENGSYEAYKHMKCYVNFVRTRLIPHYTKFDQADHRIPPRVRYGDLWSLFRVGELVCQQDAVYQKDTDKCGDSQPDSENPRTDATGPHLWRILRILTSVPAWAVDDLSLTGGSKLWGVSKEAHESTTMLVYYVDFDGKSYDAIPHDFVIPFFEGEKDVTNLPIYPVRFAKDYEQTVKQLQQRGEKFQSVVSQAHRLQSYEGWTLIRDPSGKAIQDANGQQLKFPEHIDGDVIIDFQEALQIHPWWKPQFGSYVKDTTSHVYSKDYFSINSWVDKEPTKLLGRTWEWTYAETDVVAALEYNHFVATKESIISIDHEMTNNRNSVKLQLSPEELALLPSRIFVYALRERKFVNADIQYLRQSTVKENPFESLEIAEDHKDLIISTVFEHFERKTVRREAQRQGLEISDQDFIRGKGRGLIILLHGAPGVGKTATAEACSYAYNKPLFPITCGDLGIEPRKVEETLSELFRLANLWDCILLFDEADIFLSTREKKDDNLQRNALVSIFLRTLEYYSGVLFLTTNRAGVLDEAVKSRVHVSLYYPYLGLSQTKALFQMNIGRLRNIEAERAKITGKPPMAIEEKRILKFAEEHYMRFEKEYDKRWNGRQIRNAFQIATSLARHQYHRHCLEGNSHRGLYMTSEHFQAVEDATNKYDEYRRKLFNKTDVEIAKEREER